MKERSVGKRKWEPKPREGRSAGREVLGGEGVAPNESERVAGSSWLILDPSLLLVLCPRRPSCLLLRPCLYPGRASSCVCSWSTSFGSALQPAAPLLLLLASSKGKRDRLTRVEFERERMIWEVAGGIAWKRQHKKGYPRLILAELYARVSEWKERERVRWRKASGGRRKGKGARGKKRLQESANGAQSGPCWIVNRAAAQVNWE